MESVFVSLAVVAVVKLVDLVSQHDYASALKIILAAAVGGLAGSLHIQGLDLVSGIQAGLIASGIVTAAKIVGK